MRWGITRRDNSTRTPFDSFRREIDSVFDEFFSLKPSSLFDSDWLPSIDVDENEKEFTVTAELPGMEEKDINVTLENNILTIAGEKKEEKEEKDENRNRYHAERCYGSFSRSVSLPEEIKQDKIKAKFKNGVLSINIPKDESAEKKRISVKVN